MSQIKQLLRLHKQGHSIKSIARSLAISKNTVKSYLIKLATGKLPLAELLDLEDPVITGPTGVGKSYIASALGHQACAMGYRVAYYNTAKLFTRLHGAKADNSLYREIARIEKQDLLILDDFGLQNLDKPQRDLLMEIIEDRHNKKSTISASQLPVSAWYEVICLVRK